MVSKSRGRQTRIYLDGFAGKSPAIPLIPHLLEQQALRALSARAAGYLAGGASAECTMAANREAFDCYRIVQRVLRNVKDRDLSVELFGQRLPLPMLLAPIGVLELAHRHADLAAARAASGEGISFVASSQASYPLEDIAHANGRGCRWFQLYWSARDEIARSFVARAEAAGYSAIVVALDTTELGWRPRDLSRGYLPFMAGRGMANYVSDPVFMSMEADDGGAAGGEMPPMRLGLIRSVLELIRSWPEGPLEGLRAGTGMMRAVRKFIALYSRPDLTWDDLPRLREWTQLPILLKGIVHPDDARRALALGVDGVIVSNHGGRQVDGAIAALHALPKVVDAVGGAVPVLFDSGIRTGADIIKALALGARAVLIGRPYVYGLALGGEAGVRAVIANLAADLDANLGLSGHRAVSELDRSIFADPV